MVTGSAPLGYDDWFCDPYLRWLGLQMPSLPVSEDGPQLTAQTQLHQHVHVLLVAERPVQPETSGIGS